MQEEMCILKIIWPASSINLFDFSVLCITKVNRIKSNSQDSTVNLQPLAQSKCVIFKVQLPVIQDIKGRKSNLKHYTRNTLTQIQR